MLVSLLIFGFGVTKFDAKRPETDQFIFLKPTILQEKRIVVKQLCAIT